VVQKQNASYFFNDFGIQKLAAKISRPNIVTARFLSISTRKGVPIEDLLCTDSIVMDGRRDGRRFVATFDLCGFLLGFW